MRDSQRLRKEANRLFAQKDKANATGQIELAERINVRAVQFEQDAAVLEAVDLRLKAERSDTKTRPKLSLVWLGMIAPKSASRTRPSSTASGLLRGPKG
jgi:hypothetical protein